MERDTRSPQYMMPSFICPRCHALAGQEWYGLIRRSADGSMASTVLKDTTIVATPSPAGGKVGPAEWSASKCFACKNHSIWIGATLAYPDPQKALADVVHTPHEEMPDDAAELYKEAVSVLPFSRRASAALCRASMERLVKVLDPECPKRAKLDERLARLEGRVSSTTIDLLNVLRHVGNTALHGGQDGDGSATIYIDEDDETIAETFFVVINTLVDELITKPRRSAELYNKLPAGVRHAYETKARRMGE